MRREDYIRRYIKKVNKLMVNDKDTQRIYNIIAFIGGYYGIDIFGTVEEEIKKDKLELLEFWLSDK